ncbi:fas-associated protein with death domain [Plakobranchus ocellatus]|uniref:Fas-associated protein with death domain n=1 Tax=Plakobranchus ocellatus TaxID=259542 RepID=A0AAV4E144_9GAST|nr:fas-associated protein with death domain [Plakobranchus ocellatus]
MASPQSRFIPDFVQNGELKYNVTLTKIAKDLGGKDLRKLKFILAGPCGISKREMEKVTTAEDLFMCLKQRMMLTRDNLLFLQFHRNINSQTDSLARHTASGIKIVVGSLWWQKVKILAPVRKSATVQQDQPCLYSSSAKIGVFSCSQNPPLCSPSSLCRHGD